MSYSFPGVPGLAAGGSGDNEKEREVRISSLIPMGSTNMVRINIHIAHVYLLIIIVHVNFKCLQLQSQYTMQLCIASFQMAKFPFLTMDYARI